MSDGLTNGDRDRLFQTLGRIEQQGKDTHDRVVVLETEMGDMKTGGCAVGSVNSIRLDKVEKAKTTSNASSATWGGGVAALLVAVAEAVRRMFPAGLIAFSLFFACGCEESIVVHGDYKVFHAEGQGAAIADEDADNLTNPEDKDKNNGNT